MQDQGTCQIVHYFPAIDVAEIACYLQSYVCENQQYPVYIVVAHCSAQACLQSGMPRRHPKCP